MNSATICMHIYSNWRIMMKSLIGLAVTGLLGIASTGALAQEGVRTNVRAAQTPANSILVGARLGAVDVGSLGDPVVSYGAFGEYALGDKFLVGGSLD